MIRSAMRSRSIERLGYESGMWDTYIRTDSNIISNTQEDGRHAGERRTESQQRRRDLLHGPSRGPARRQSERRVASVRTRRPRLRRRPCRPDGLRIVAGVWRPALARGSTAIRSPAPARSSTKIPPFRPRSTFRRPSLQRRVLSAAAGSRATRSTCSCASTSNVPATPVLHADGDYPLAWAKMYGKGRVFFGSFAHANETWDHSQRAADVLRGHQMGTPIDGRRAHAAPDARQHCGFAQGRGAPPQ